MGIEELYEKYIKNPAKWSAGKYRDFQDWQDAMGYDDRSIMFDISDALGLSGTDAPAFDPELRGTGKEDGWLSEKLPNMWKSYDTQKDFADAGIEMTPEENPILDTAQRSMSLGSDLAKVPINVIDDVIKTSALGVESAGDLIYDMTKWGLGGAKPEGIGGLETYWMDTLGPFLGPLTNGKGSGMVEKSREIIGSYAPPANIIDEFDQLDLGRWDMYQNWKKGSGWDSADDRKISKKVKAQMDKMNFGHEAMWPMFIELSQDPKNAHIIENEEAINFYYDNMVKNVKEATSKGLTQEFEFAETGDDYGKWASHNYQNELLSEFGRYPLADGINHLPAEMYFNLSPWGEDDMSSIFNLANDDYINALQEGKSGMTPTEWDYGLFDDDKSVGIDEKYVGELMDYSTPEATEFAHAPQMMALELIGGGGLLKTPKLLNKLQRHKLLQDTKAGRYLREFAPGLFQWGKRDKFGFPKFKDAKWEWNRKGLKKILNAGISTVDFARPKGLQFGAAAAASEWMDDD